MNFGVSPGGEERKRLRMGNPEAGQKTGEGAGGPI